MDQLNKLKSFLSRLFGLHGKKKDARRMRMIHNGSLITVMSFFAINFAILFSLLWRSPSVNLSAGQEVRLDISYKTSVELKMTSIDTNTYNTDTQSYEANMWRLMVAAYHKMIGVDLQIYNEGGGIIALDLFLNGPNATSSFQLMKGMSTYVDLDTYKNMAAIIRAITPSSVSYGMYPKFSITLSIVGTTFAILFVTILFIDRHFAAKIDSFIRPDMYAHRDLPTDSDQIPDHIVAMEPVVQEPDQWARQEPMEPAAPQQEPAEVVAMRNNQRGNTQQRITFQAL